MYKSQGAASLATVCRQYGLKMPIGRIREAACTDRQGTSAAGLLAAAKELGLFAKAVRGDAGALRSRFPLPAIAHVKTPEGVWHYVVLHQVAVSYTHLDVYKRQPKRNSSRRTA